MRYVDEHDRAARRLSFEWFNEVLFFVPAVSAWLLGVRAAFDVPVGFGYPVPFTQLELWGLATSAMLGGIGGATWRASRQLQPAALVRRVRLDDSADTPLQKTEREIRQAQFSVHELLDMPAVAFLGYGIVTTSDIALALSIGYSLVAFVLARPDDQRLVRETMIALRQ